MRELRVTVVSEIPTPYRDPVFARIHQMESVKFQVLYCASTEFGREWKFEKKTYPCEILPGFSLIFSRKNLHPWKINPGIWRRLSQNPSDVVIIAGYSQPTMILAMLWCRRHKIPYILWSESHHLSARSLWKQIAKKSLVRWAVAGASAYLVLGSPAQDYLVSYGADPRKIFFFPNAPDVEKFLRQAETLRQDREKLRLALGLQGNPLLLFIGRLIPVKNVETLLKAFREIQREIPDAGLAIVGDGPSRSSLEALAGRLHLRRVQFTGAILPDDAAQYYAVADLLVLCSLSETWGAVVLEAMACGLPVVLSDRVGCAKDLVENRRTGFVVPATDVQRWSECLVRLLQNPSLLQEMGGNSKKLAKQWDYNFCLAQLKQALEKAVRNQG